MKPRSTVVLARRRAVHQHGLGGMPPAGPCSKSRHARRAGVLKRSHRYHTMDRRAVSSSSRQRMTTPPTAAEATLARARHIHKAPDRSLSHAQLTLLRAVRWRTLLDRSHRPSSRPRRATRTRRATTTAMHRVGDHPRIRALLNGSHRRHSCRPPLATPHTRRATPTPRARRILLPPTRQRPRTSHRWHRVLP